jgi:hypothetical protein
VSTYPLPIYLGYWRLSLSATWDQEGQILSQQGGFPRELRKGARGLRHIQGGALNRGLLFSSPLPPRSWVCEPQKCCNLIGCGPSSGINIGVGVGRASVAMDHAYRQLIAKKLHAGSNVKTSIFSKQFVSLFSIR